MKTIYCVLLTGLLGCSAPVNYTYWENIPENKKISIIEGSEFNKQISEIDELNDKHYPISMDEMLTQLTSPAISDSLLPFYFATFNRWCLTSDGAISEIMGPYCMNMLLNYPDYVLNYFQAHPDLMDSYASAIGFELSFADEENRADPASRIFFETLKNKTQNFRHYEKVYDSFCAVTRRWIEQSMD